MYCIHTRGRVESKLLPTQLPNKRSPPPYSHLTGALNRSAKLTLIALHLVLFVCGDIAGVGVGEPSDDNVEALAPGLAHGGRDGATQPPASHGGELAGDAEDDQLAHP